MIRAPRPRPLPCRRHRRGNRKPIGRKRRVENIARMAARRKPRSGIHRPDHGRVVVGLHQNALVVRAEYPPAIPSTEGSRSFERKPLLQSPKLRSSLRRGDGNDRRSAVKGDAGNLTAILKLSSRPPTFPPCSPQICTRPFGLLVMPIAEPSAVTSRRERGDRAGVTGDRRQLATIGTRMKRTLNRLAGAARPGRAERLAGRSCSRRR